MINVALFAIVGVLLGFVAVGFLYGLMARATGWDPINATEEVTVDE